MPLKDPVARREHYRAWYLKKNAGKEKRKPGRPPSGLTPLQRFVKYIRFDESGCQLWTGARRGAYGSFKVLPGVNEFAHRAAILLAGIPIPRGAVVLHAICDNPLCVNVSHLRVGTHQDNSTDMILKRRSTAGRGRFPHGVTRARNKRQEKYNAMIWDRGKQVYLGVFCSVEEAASAVSEYRDRRIEEIKHELR